MQVRKHDHHRIIVKSEKNEKLHKTKT